MRIVFMGTPDFALPTLQRLIESRHEIPLVVTQADKPAGRGRKVQPPAVKELALKHGLDVAQPESMRDTEAQKLLRKQEADVFVVVAYGKILPEEVLAIPRLGCINVHASLLPRWRGAAPINRAMMAGDLKSGVTLMKMDSGMDTGDILKTEEVPILEDDDALSLGNMLSMVGADALEKYLDEVEETGAIEGRAQDDSGVTYAPMLRKEEGRIDWNNTTASLVLHIRGLVPWPAAYTESSKGTLRIFAAEPLWPSEIANIKRPDSFDPGMVAHTLKGHGFAVRTLDGFLLVKQAQPPGKRPLSGNDLVNGGYVKIGDSLGKIPA